MGTDIFTINNLCSTEYMILLIINLTEFLGAEAIERAGIIARQADVVAGLTLEVLKGTSRAFDSGKYGY